MSRLPQELIDKIIDQVYPWDRRALGACSLVCSQWSSRSRKYLFIQVELYSPTDLERWCAHIRPGPQGPSSLVEDLSLLDGRLSMSAPDGTSWFQSSVLSKATTHLRSFSGLRALRIMGWDTVAVSTLIMLRHFDPLPETVTRLTLERMFISPVALLTFISRFPHLDHLFISTIKNHWKVDDTGGLLHESHGSIVPTHPHGEFTAFEVGRFDEPEKIFGGIALLEPQFRRVAFRFILCNMWRSFWPVVEACAESLEELVIEVSSMGE